MRVASLLLVALSGTSCLTPSCVDRVFGPPHDSPNSGHFATLTLYSQPVEEQPVEERPPAGAGMDDRLRRSAFITIDDKGSMRVSRADLWPQSCPTISRHDLATVSQLWQPVLAGVVAPPADVQVMADAPSGLPDGPLLSLQVGPLSKNIGIRWDGEAPLPAELEVAVLATLELVCSNSRLAKRHLLRDLPRQVASRLTCRGKEGSAP